MFQSLTVCTLGLGLLLVVLLVGLLDENLVDSYPTPASTTLTLQPKKPFHSFAYLIVETKKEKTS